MVSELRCEPMNSEYEAEVAIHSTKMFDRYLLIQICSK
jgi:hypothetical protein